MVLISVSEPEKPLPVFVTFRWQYMSYGFCSKIAIKTFLITYWSVTGAEQSLWRPHLVDRLMFLSLAIRHNQIFRVFQLAGKLDIILQVVVKCQIYAPIWNDLQVGWNKQEINISGGQSGQFPNHISCSRVLKSEKFRKIPPYFRNSLVWSPLAQNPFKRCCMDLACFMNRFWYQNIPE